MENGAIIIDRQMQAVKIAERRRSLRPTVYRYFMKQTKLNWGEEVYSSYNISSSITQVSINIESKRKGVYLVRTVTSSGVSRNGRVIIQ